MSKLFDACQITIRSVKPHTFPKYVYSERMECIREREKALLPDFIRNMNTGGKHISYNNKLYSKYGNYIFVFDDRTEEAKILWDNFQVHISHLTSLIGKSISPFEMKLSNEFQDYSTPHLIDYKERENLWQLSIMCEGPNLGSGGRPTMGSLIVMADIEIEIGKKHCATCTCD